MNTRPTRPQAAARLAALILITSSAAGCEDFFTFLGEDAKSSAEEAKAQAPAVEKPTKAAEKPAAMSADDRVSGMVAVRAYTGCLEGCYDPKISETDRATCQLTCDEATKANVEGAAGELRGAITASMPGILERANSCFGECLKAQSVDDRETCKLNCGLNLDTYLRDLEFTPTPPATPGPACDETCAARRERCEDGCERDSALSVDDRATCKLTCGEQVTACVETCNKRAS
ncbi:MAG: hypothetical protein R3A51_16530 [Nannocystaceae bacterium]